MKIKEELNIMNEEYIETKKESTNLTEVDFKQVTGGMHIIDKNDKKCPFCGQIFQYQHFFHHLMKCDKKKAHEDVK